MESAIGFVTSASLDPAPATASCSGLAPTRLPGGFHGLWLEWQKLRQQRPRLAGGHSEPIFATVRSYSGVRRSGMISLGDNCEFGLVQRRGGAEPLGLLRFASIFLPIEIRLEKLAAVLERKFEGLCVAETMMASRRRA
jgi:hypothetical protein